MKIIDDKGRLFGKLSIIDIIIIVVVCGLAAGFIYRSVNEDIRQIINPNDTFYLTLKGDHVRQFSVDAVEVGDVFYKKYDSLPLGPVVKIEAVPAQDILLRPDGTAGFVEMEGRYALYITVRCTGTVNESGFYANGSLHLAEGSEMLIQSNRLFVISEIYRVNSSLE